MKRILHVFFIFVIILSITCFPSIVYATEVVVEGEQESPAVDELPSEETQVEAQVNNSLWPSGPGIESLSAVVMELDSGTVVYEKAPLEAHYPASITKVMTALVALENSSLDEVVTFSRNAVFSLEPGSSSISRDVGEQMTMEECIYALLLESANEVGNAIAEHISGDTASFAELMNKKAAELGCINTHFANPHGLHDDNHYTCAHDMAIIARAAYQNPTFALITGTKSYTIPPTNKHEDPTPLNNHHAMLHYYRTNQHIYEYCVGGKTGYTSKALSTLVTYARKDGVTLICVVMCTPAPGQYTDTRALMDYYLNNMQKISVNILTDQMSEIAGDSISMMLGKDEVPFVVDENASIFIPKNADMSQLYAGFEAPDEDSASSILGRIYFEYGGKGVGSADLIGMNVETYPFKNVVYEESGDPEAKRPILINIYYVIILAVVVLAVIIFARIVIIRANTAVSTMRRKRIENRDPHKDMRRIKRRRRSRQRREWERDRRR